MTDKADMRQVHSNAEAFGDGRLSAPAAVRNSAAIVAALAGWLPESGTVLELAAGTGEHAVALARANPGLIWQPSDVAPERLASIDAWRAVAQLPNLNAATALDATTADWSVEEPVAAVFLANLMHLLPEPAAARVIAGAARALVPGGRVLLYGPFREGGAFRSEGDARFDDSLRRSDPAIGYKDVEWIEATAARAGFAARARLEMPANNLIVVLDKA